MSYLSHYVFFLLTFLLFQGCTTSQQGKEASTKLLMDPAHEARITNGVLLEDAQENVLTFHLISEGELSMEQIHRVEVVEDGGSYVYRELYNVYESKTPYKKEYYVSEFTLRPDDLEGIHQIYDYRIVHTQDSARLYMNEISRFQLEREEVVEVDGDKHSIFELWGFAHSHTPQDTVIREFTPANPPVYRRYWTPSIGTLLVLFPDDVRLELHHTETPADTVLIRKLQAVVAKRL